MRLGTAIFPLAILLMAPPIDTQLTLSAQDQPAPEFKRSDFAKFTGISALALSPDGKLLAAGTVGGMIELVDTGTGKSVKILDTIGPKEGFLAARSLAFHPQGQLLAAGGSSKGVQLWDIPTEKRVATLASEEMKVIAFSPQGDRLALGGWDKNSTTTQGKVEVWDVETRKRVATHGHPRKVSCVTFSPDGKRLAFADDGQALAKLEDVFLNFQVPGEVTLVSLAEKGIHSWKGHSKGLHSLAFSSDSKLLATGGVGEVRLWNCDAGKEAGVLTIDRENHRVVVALTFSKSGDSLIWAVSARTQQPGDTIQVASVTERKVSATLTGHKLMVNALVMSKDGKTLYSGAGSQHLLAGDLSFLERELKVWDLEKQKERGFGK